MIAALSANAFNLAKARSRDVFYGAIGGGDQPLGWQMLEGPHGCGRASGSRAEHGENVAESFRQSMIHVVFDGPGVAESQHVDVVARLAGCTRPLRCSNRDGFQRRSTLTCARSHWRISGLVDTKKMLGRRLHHRASRN